MATANDAWAVACGDARLRARAPPFRYTPSSRSPVNSQHLSLPLPKTCYHSPSALSVTHPPILYLAIGGRMVRQKSASLALLLRSLLQPSPSEGPSLTMPSHCSSLLSSQLWSLNSTLWNHIILRICYSQVLNLWIHLPPEMYLEPPNQYLWHSAVTCEHAQMEKIFSCLMNIFPAKASSSKQVSF